MRINYRATNEDKIKNFKVSSQSDEMISQLISKDLELVNDRVDDHTKNQAQMRELLKDILIVISYLLDEVANRR